MGYTNLVGSFVYKEPLFVAKLDALAANDAQLKTDGWAQSTKTLFYQAAVPTGWTQDASQNDKALRVVGVSAGGGSGGTQALSATITMAHTHSVSADDGHTHAYADHTHTFATGSGGNNRGNPTAFYLSDGVYFQRWIANPSGTVKNPLKALMASPGAITLGTQAAHDHGGATDQQLTDAVFAYVDVLIGTKNAPGGSYTDLTTYWLTGGKIDFDPFASYAGNDSYNLGNLMPAGSIALFVQATAPVSWTKIAGANDRMLRVVSGTGGGTGGTQLISSGLTLMHTHSLTAVVDHTHSIPSHQHQINQTNSSGGQGNVVGAGIDATPTYIQAASGTLVDSQDSGATSSRTVYKTQSVSSGGTTDAAGGHTHTLPNQLTDLVLAYLDVIQCSKDSTGAPYSYTDYTSEFAWKKLVSYQRLNTLAQNDAYLVYHTTVTGTGMLFFMASPPIGWNKITTHDDMALRIVSGSSGGTVGGGAQGVSQTISLAHDHSIVAAGGHNHNVTHTHNVDSGTQTARDPSATVVEGRGGAQQISSGHTGGNIQSSVTLGPVSVVPIGLPVADPDHNHGGNTGSALSDVTLAYVDLIYCVKS